MRECPVWFQNELTRIGGTNQFGEPIFKLVWSTGEHRVIGGRWEADGFEGYRTAKAIPGAPCWALMYWEPNIVNGSLEQWESDYRDPETGYLQCGGYPKYGAYRVLRRFLHQEIISKPETSYQMQDGKPVAFTSRKAEHVQHRLEPCGLMLDLMVPMLKLWLKLSDSAKTEAILQDERMREEEFNKQAKDLRADCKVRRGSQLVQKRAELIEKSLGQAMAIAANYGLGMRIAN